MALSRFVSKNRSIPVTYIPVRKCRVHFFRVDVINFGECISYKIFYKMSEVLSSSVLFNYRSTKYRLHFDIYKELQLQPYCREWRISVTPHKDRLHSWANRRAFSSRKTFSYYRINYECLPRYRFRSPTPGTCHRRIIPSRLSQKYTCSGMIYMKIELYFSLYIQSVLLL